MNVIVGIIVGILLMAGLAIVATSTLWVLAILKSLAKKNLFFTEVKEGTAKAITKFGEFHHCIMSYKEHYFNDKWNLIDGTQSDGAKKDENSPAKKSWIDRILPGGLCYIGLPFIYEVHRYSFRWTSLRQGGSPTNTGISTKEGQQQVVEEKELLDLFISSDKMLDYINLTDDVYVLRMEKIEDEEMIPLNFRALVTARVVNPYKALFRTEQWLEIMFNTLRPIIRQYVGLRKFKDLVQKVEGPEHESDEILKIFPQGATLTVKDYIENRWGIRIKSIGIVNINTAENARGASYEEAAATKYKADQEAKRILTIAEANAAQTVILAEANAKGIKIVTKQMTKLGPDAFTLRAIEAIEEAGKNGNTIIIGGEKPIQMLLSAAKDKGGNV